MTEVSDDESTDLPQIDLIRSPLLAYIRPDNEVLQLCLKRLLHDIDDPDGVISAFGNAP